MDIGSRFGYPAGALSNFAPHRFEIDGVECASMEGFLQSLKTDDPLIQKEICQLAGIMAKERGIKYDAIWKKTQTLHWQGRKYNRHGSEYQELIDRAYNELVKNEEFKKALLATGQENLTHSVGKTDPFETILTEKEFCSRLMRLRSEISP